MEKITMTGLKLNLWLLCGLIASMGLSPLQTRAQDASQQLEVQQALQEMAEIEAQLGQMRHRRNLEALELLRHEEDRRDLDQRLERQGDRHAQGLEVFESRERALLRERDDLTAEMARQEAAATRARKASRQATQLLLDPEATDTPLVWYGMAALRQHQRRQSRWHTSEYWRLNEAINTVDSRQREANAQQQHYNVFTQLSVQALNERHAALVERIETLQTARDASQEREATLAAERQKLQELMQSLVAQAVDAPESNEEAAELSARGAPEVDTTDDTVLPTLEASNEDDSVEAVTVSTQNKGTRQLFWHASPVEVQAILTGKVVFSGPFAGYRHLLILDHGQGWRTLYGNLSDCELKAGEIVPNRKRLGTYEAGHTGGADPFWFEVRHAADAVVPESWDALAPGWESRLFARPTLVEPAL